ncbi:MAG: LON peptidase substrate-binding domain-containing protein [Anaerolineae bacterium]
MYELPLFPLNTILFPGMPLHLHIFEERYKKMMNQCIAEEKPFGVVLIKSGKEAGDSAEPYDVGCTAVIDQVQPLKDGRMNMSALGGKRFKIHELNHDQPYLVGLVEDMPFDKALSKDDKIKGWYLQKLVKNYIDVLSSVGDIDIGVENLPKEPIKLAYMTAMLLQSPFKQKQALLELGAANELIHAVYDACRREISVLRSMLNPVVSPHQDGPFSLN